MSTYTWIHTTFCQPIPGSAPRFVNLHLDPRHFLSTNTWIRATFCQPIPGSVPLLSTFTYIFNTFCQPTPGFAPLLVKQKLDPHPFLSTFTWISTTISWKGFIPIRNWLDDGATIRNWSLYPGRHFAIFSRVLTQFSLKLHHQKQFILLHSHSCFNNLHKQISWTPRELN